MITQFAQVLARKVFMHEPIIIRPSEQPTFEGPPGVVAKVLIDAETTSAANLALGHITFGAGSSVPPHTRDVEEFIYVVSGATTIHAVGKEWELGAGDAIYIPPGTEHQHTNPNKEDLHQIYIFSPPGPEQAVRQWPKRD